MSPLLAPFIMPQVNPRRRFLLGSAAFVGGMAAIGMTVNNHVWKSRTKPVDVSALGQVAARNSSSPLLSSIVDTIAPRDEFAGGLDLGIDISLERQAATQDKTKMLLARLLPSIDRAAKQGYQHAFETLNVDQREALLNSLYTDRSTPLQRRDFLRLRQLVLTEYYRSQAGHASLGYQLPSNYANYHG